jgi:hypothetical protein
MQDLILGYCTNNFMSFCLVNFCLNKLENVIQSIYRVVSIFLNKKQKKKKNILSLKMLRFGIDFIVLTNSSSIIRFLNHRISIFLSERGFLHNIKRTFFLPLQDRSKFEFLGFFFHIILFPNKKGRVARS